MIELLFKMEGQSKYLSIIFIAKGKFGYKDKWYHGKDESDWFHRLKSQITRSHNKQVKWKLIRG